MSAITLRDVIENADTAMEFSDDKGQGFVPVTRLKGLTSFQAIKEFLDDPDINPTKNIDTSTLARFYSEKAFKVFAIIAVSQSSCIGLLEHFYRNDFRDMMLPVFKKKTIKNGTRNWEIKSHSEEVFDVNIVADVFRLNPGGPWTKRHSYEVDDFCRWQWPFVPPIFLEGKFRYNFPKETQLPFTKRGAKKDSEFSLYSYVQDMSVHVDHVPKNLETVLDEEGNVRVAIKELKRFGKNFAQVAEGEAIVLEMMRKLGNEPHLIKAIAYYKQGDNHYFMFPWAELGNLWEFWGKNEPKIEQDDYVIWAFTQLSGLAGALERLHHRATETEENCRHGDLKPGNILCFRTNDNQKDKPRLVITDVGLAKVHNKATRERLDMTSSKAGTVTHAAPELEVDPETPRSRRFDIWSMGCILLEFTIWLLYGSRKLQHFTDCLNGSSFYVVEIKIEDSTTPGQQLLSPTYQKREKKIAKVHPEVENWISYIRDDWRCSPGTAVHRLVDLIETRLLKIAIGNTNATNDNSSPILPTTEQFSSSQAPPMILGETMTLEPGSTSTPIITTTSVLEPDTIPQTSANRREPKRQRTADMPPDPHSRAYAPEMKRELETILHLLKFKETPFIGTPPSNQTAPPPGPSRKQTAGKDSRTGTRNTWQNDYRFTPLNDDWDYAPDDTIAKAVFPGLDPSNVLPRASQPSQLCRRCKALPMWSIVCTFTDSLAGLMEKANNERCALCRLLLQGVKPQEEGHPDFVRFARVGSYLTIEDGGGQAIANLYTMPGSPESNSQDIQIGFPKLPESGSATHLKVMKEWIRCCDISHECYPKNLDFLPTRLLDVSSSDSGIVKLVNLGRGSTGLGGYVALSHRWGSPELNRKFCTEKSNFEDLQRGIEVSLLPKTFQDAIYITRGLGLSRIWIDSLCIIQDDPDDWEAEAKLMERVFSSAYCTIAASCASGTSDGFLKPRPDRRSVVMQGPPGDGSYFVCETIDDFHHDVDQGELNKRGWVLQERALSRRTIYFTETQSYWECGGGVRCETMTKMKNPKASFLGDANFPNAAERFVKGKRIELIQDLYERYSQLGLSYPSDRPTAIKGLETRLLSTFGTTGGYGVFDIYLHRCLLWQRAGDNLERIKEFHGGKLVPSWSWMAYDGAIQYMVIPFGQAEWSNDIISPFVRAVQPDILNDHGKDSITNTSMLELEAPVWEVVSTQAAQMILDDSHQALPQSLHCVIVGKSKHDPIRYYVLLIRPLAQGATNEIHERVGVAILEHHHISFHGPQRTARVR